MRKIRSDCRVGTLEKNMVYHLERLEIQMEEMRGQIKKQATFVKTVKKENKDKVRKEDFNYCRSLLFFNFI